MPQTQPPLIGTLLLHQKTKRRKQQMFRLLLHDEMDQHRNANQQQAAQEKGMYEAHEWIIRELNHEEHEGTRRNCAMLSGFPLISLRAPSCPSWLIHESDQNRFCLCNRYSIS